MLSPLSDAPVRVPSGALDPVAMIPGLVAAGGGDHVVHEREGEWTVGFGATAEILADHDGVRLLHAGGVRDLGRSASPLTQVEALLGELPGLSELGDDPWSAFGWVSADVGCSDVASPGGAEGLAHLVVPRTVVRLSATGASVSSPDPDVRHRLLEVLERAPASPPASRPVAVDTGVNAAEYRAAVDKALAAIGSGRVHKVVLSRPVPVTVDLDFPATYAAGRRVNAPARSVLLSMRGVDLVGFCPETIICVDATGSFTAEPLAGTRACPSDPVEAARLEQELRWDPKEVFEHSISVRAMLDSLRAVSEPDGVAVDDLLSIRRRGSVQHLASRLRGRLAAGCSAWDAFAATFPAVTATGAPRPEAHALIGELESSPRGLYAGAAVRVDHDGGFDSSLILRAVHRREGRTWLQAGGGIVADSDPDREVEETTEKLTSIAAGLVARP